MSVWELYTQIFARNWRYGRFARSLSQGCREKIRKKDIVMTAGRWSSWSIQIPQFLMLWWPSMKAGSTAMTQRPRDRVPSGSMLALQTQEGQTEQIHPQTFYDPFFDSTGMTYMRLIPTGQTVNKEYYVEVLREFRKRFRRKRPALFKSGQWHFHQDNAPGHNSIFVTDYLTKMGIMTVPYPPYSPDLAPCDFWLFPKLKEKFRDCRYETIEGWKRLWRRSLTRSHKRTSMGFSEVVGMVQQVHCSRRRLLRSGQEFHVCTINKITHTKKPGNLLKALRIRIGISP